MTLIRTINGIVKTVKYTRPNKNEQVNTKKVAISVSKSIQNKSVQFSRKSFKTLVDTLLQFVTLW